MTKTTNQSWELHPFNLFRLYKSTEENGNSHDDHLKASLLLQVSESGKAEDNFRFNIEGDVSIEVEFGGEDLLANKLFKPFSFNMVVRPDDLDIKRNGLSGTWDDLQQAISEGFVLVQKKNSSSGAKKEFLDLWDEEKVKNPNFGAAIRWAILACEGGSDWTSRGCQEWPPLSEKTPDCSVMPAQQSPSPPWSWRSTWSSTLRLMARCPSSSQETRLKPHPTSRGTQRPSSQVGKSVFENKNIIGNFNNKKPI